MYFKYEVKNTFTFIQYSIIFIDFCQNLMILLKNEGDTGPSLDSPGLDYQNLPIISEVDIGRG